MSVIRRTSTAVWFQIMDLRAETGSSNADRHDCLEVAGQRRSSFVADRPCAIDRRRCSAAPKQTDIRQEVRLTFAFGNIDVGKRLRAPPTPVWGPGRVGHREESESDNRPGSQGRSPLLRITTSAEHVFRASIPCRPG